MARNVTGSRRGFGWDAQNQRLNLYVNGQAVNYFDEPIGRTYYVNNLTGSSTNDGLSWGMAMDQVETAVAASEVYRQLQTNQYERNTIMIAGSDTVYTKITSAPFYVNVIGLGGPCTYGGVGQVKIGSETDGSGAEPGDHRAATWENVMFNYGASGHYGFDCDVILGDYFYNVSFLCGAGSASGGLYAATEFAGNIVERCRFANAGGGTPPLYGIRSADGTFSENHIFDCTFTAGTTAGIYFASGGIGTVIKRNIFGCQTQAEGIQDASTNGYAIIAENTFTAACTDAVVRTAYTNSARNIQTAADVNS